MILDLPLELIDLICEKMDTELLVDILHNSELIFTPFFDINKARFHNYWINGGNKWKYDSLIRISKIHASRRDNNLDIYILDSQ
jgi:hypothetical protein